MCREPVFDREDIDIRVRLHLMTGAPVADVWETDFWEPHWPGSGIGIDYWMRPNEP